MSIGTKLSRLRKQTSFSTAQIAKKLEISEETYTMFEKDEAKPEMNLLKKISDLYGIEVFDLLSTESSINFHNSRIEATNLINQNSVINQQLPAQLFSIYENRIKELENEITLLKNKEK